MITKQHVAGFVVGVGFVWLWHNFLGPHLPGSSKG